MSSLEINKMKEGKVLHDHGEKNDHQVMEKKSNLFSIWWIVAAGVVMGHLFGVVALTIYLMLVKSGVV